MKIGIVTYFNIKNYGSALQAFALRHFLTKHGYEAKFLSIREDKPIHKLLHQIHVILVTGAKCLLSKEARHTQREILRLKKETSLTSPESLKAFELFEKEELPSVRIGRIALKKVAHSDEYHAFICGSDQIWSPLSPHLSGFKFLDFAPKNKRIAYAPSFGVSKIPTYNRAFIKRKLSEFEDISVRESDGANIVRSLTGRDVPILLDPTMLLTGEQWRDIYRRNIADKNTEKYVLCYFFDEPDLEIVQRIVNYANNRNLKIKVLFPSNKAFINFGAECVNAGPLEFLQLVDNAQCIFTNSFHGCVFSVLFNKAFIAFGRNHSESVKQTSRILTLLETVGAPQSFYSEQSGFHFPNTAAFEPPISELREISRKYLLDCLKKRCVK